MKGYMAKAKSEEWMYEESEKEDGEEFEVKAGPKRGRDGEEKEQGWDQSPGFTLFEDGS